MINLNLNKKKWIGLTFILLFLVSAISMNLIPKDKTNPAYESSNMTPDVDQDITDKSPKPSLPPTSYSWWNVNWSFRIPVSVSSTNDQEDAPVELFINFTEYFNDLSVNNPWLDKYSIRVIEYESSSVYWEIDCEFEQYERIYDNETNAVGDVIWILNGSTPQGTTRDYFIYFNNGSIPEVETDYYTNLRVWHEGFETYYNGDIKGGISGQDTYSTSSNWEISNTTSSRGQSSLHIWGNCWKDELLDGFDFSQYPNAKVTAKMRFDDLQIDREISGLGFHNIRTSIPASSNSYNIRGNQGWGSAESYKYRNQYYAQNTFFWYTLSYIAHDDYVFYIADDDSYTDRDLYWDDISFWDTSYYDVQTVPDHMLQINTGDIEAASFRLDITCLDENEHIVPNAKVYLTNNSDSFEDLGESNQNGVANFLDLKKGGVYNITINYTQNGLDDPKTETVYQYENYEILKLDNSLIANLNLTSFYFNITDNDGDPIQYGYVLLKDTGIDVGKGILNVNGNATIRWINDTSYDFEVYYDFNLRPEVADYVESELKIIDNKPLTKIYNNEQANMSKLYFNVTEWDSKNPFPYAKLRIFNQSTTDSIANLTVGTLGTATFIYFADNYGEWGDYTVDVFFAGTKRGFHVNDGGALINDQDFTLSTEFNMDLGIELNVEKFNTTITVSNYTSEVSWNGNISVEFNFTRNEPGDLNNLEFPNEIYLQILDEEDGEFSQNVDMKPYQYSKGLFNYEFNTSQFSLIGGTKYKILLSGSYESYVPAETKVSFTIISLSTEITIHNYGNPTPVTQVSQFYGEYLNISIKYFNNDTLESLKDATVSYKWLDYDFQSISQDPIYDDYYTFLIDTTSANVVGTYIITISAKLENYTSQEINVLLQIKPRTTEINGVEKLYLRTLNLYYNDPETYGYVNFQYNDTIKDPSERVENLDRATYFWYKLDAGGNPISEASEDINLNSTTSNKYLLDFDTHTKAVGNYRVIATFEKENYEPASAIIDIKINLRIMDVDIDAKGLDDDQINLVKGKEVKIEIEIIDEVTGEKVRDADVVLEIGDDEFDFDEDEPGIYTYTFSTEEYEAFYTSQTLTGEIIIKKANYETEEIDITIVVEMEEISDGVPTFYFILIIGAITAIGGSLATYRYIQVARIPKFVKKARAMKKAIKSGKQVPDSALSVTKNDITLKKLGDEWDLLGLSINNTLGIKPKSERLKKEGGEL
jgi:hypothetical protein